MSKRSKASPYICWSFKAKDFFADPYFYGDLEDVANFCAGKREEVFGEQRVSEINLKTNVQVIEFFMAVGVQGTRVISCMGRDYAKSIEDTLHDEKIVALNGESEIDLGNERFVPLRHYPCPTVPDSSPSIVCVFGPSGIGKTFFAVQHVPAVKVRRTWKQQRRVTFYVKPFELDFFHSRSKDNQRALAGWIKTKVEEMYGRFGKLKMRVALVLDDLYKHGERGDASASFESLQEELCKFASELVTVVVGLRVHDASRTYGATVFLNPLSNADVKNFASGNPFNLDHSVVDALCCVPSLSALTTDARSAWLLLKAVKDEYPVDKSSQSIWLKGLRDRAKKLAACVVNSFAQETRGLQGFDDESRRRIAAWVIHTAHTAKPYQMEMPQFGGLANAEGKSAAFSLMFVNVQFWRSEFIFVSSREKRAVTLSPAMEFVLLSVLRGPRAVVSMYDNGSTDSGAVWAQYRRRVVDFVHLLLPDKHSLGVYFKATYS
jgi:hypothetical protein